MIRSFAGREAEQIWRGVRSKRLPDDIQRSALRKLDLLDAAATVEDLRVPPGNRLEQLKGDLKGFWSIRINQQWRIIFRWVNGHAEDVEIIDYH
jgi:proteic killer suppression protein